jgi:hypothetical protein
MRSVRSPRQAGSLTAWFHGCYSRIAEKRELVARAR